MPSYSKVSLSRLGTCHPKLQVLFKAVIVKFDCTILCGYRGETEQTKAFTEHKSRLRFPHSKHNKKPSLAVDAAPYPIDWMDIERFERLAEVVKKTADELGIKIRWGGDWKRFPDYPHYELAE